MNLFNLGARKEAAPVDVPGLAAFICSLQKENGEIPWSAGGKTDPWDHVESAMGLTVAGRLEEARRAYRWSASSQLPDGSWWSALRNGEVEDWTREPNFASYIAVGVFHYFMVTRDYAFIREMWPTVKKAVEFVLRMQAPTGEIYWSMDKDGCIDRTALLTGSSSIYMSMKCALGLAYLVEDVQHDWIMPMKKLGHAIRRLPNRFNMIKSRYSMDWYYPILCGAVRGEEAFQRIHKYWDKFAVPGWGIRCVSDRPWVTMAETSELVLTLAAIGAYAEAETVFGWLHDKRYDDGTYWMGVTFPDWVVWPDEKTSWTAGAVLLAYDALNKLTPGCRLFNHDFWRICGGAVGKDIYSLVERFKALYC